MSIRINVSPAVRSISRMGLSPRQVDQATAKAINHTMSRLRTRGSRSVRAEYNIKARDISKATKIRRASSHSLRATLSASTKPLTMARFRPRLSKRGATVAIRKGHRERIPSAFAIKKRGDKQLFARGHYHRGTMQWRKRRQRKTGPDMPIQMIQTASVAGMFTPDAVSQAITAEANTRLPTRITHEIHRIVQRMATR